MPNWVYNTYSVKGNKEDVAKFRAKYFSTNENGELEFDFDKVIPEPRTKKECDSCYICDCKEKHLEVLDERDWFDWYGWRCEHWGTKWNACYTRIYCEVDDEFQFGFDTAWAPPRPIYNAIKRQNPKLRFTKETEYE